jgi:hypothetical protein
MTSLEFVKQTLLSVPRLTISYVFDPRVSSFERRTLRSQRGLDNTAILRLPRINVCLYIGMYPQQLDHGGTNRSISRYMGPQKNNT